MQHSHTSTGYAYERSETRVAHGGQAIYGAPLGILMLDTRFARIPGDVGHAETWPFPVLYQIIRGATPDRVISNAKADLLDDFIAAARELVDLGVEAITTSCGFLSIYQRELAAAVDVPVATSALMQVPWIEAMLPPGKRAGIITVNATRLTPQHLTAINAAIDTPIQGLEDGQEMFRTLVSAEKQDLDPALARKDVVTAGRELATAHPEVGAIVLECTNMPPYAAAVQAATGLPVFDIYTFIRWFYSALRPKTFTT